MNLMLATGLAMVAIYLAQWCDEAEEKKRLDRAVEADAEAWREREREQAAREYEERTRGPCGSRVEMINEGGDAQTVCERDVHLWDRRGWIVRHPDAGAP